METWKPVTGYESLYHVSDLGRVKRLVGKRSREERVLRPGRMTTHYLFVALCKDGKPKLHSVHRLVAAAFIGPIPEGHEVNHKNGVRTDNRLENLEFMTRQENIIHGQRTLPRKPTSLRGPMLPNVVLTEDQAKEIKRRGREGQRGKDIASDMGIRRHFVYGILSGRSWKWVD